MILIRKLFLSLFPLGHPWNFLGTFGGILRGLALSFFRAKSFAENSINESRPISAIDTLEQWYNALGISYDQTQTLLNRQGRASQVFTAIGGQSKAYIEEQIQKAFPNIRIEEFQINYGNMVGFGMVGQMQVATYPAWVPLGDQDGSYPVFLYKVTGSLENSLQFLQLQDILQKIAPRTHKPIFVDIAFLRDSGQVGIGQTGIMQVGKAT